VGRQDIRAHTEYAGVLSLVLEAGKKKIFNAPLGPLKTAQKRLFSHRPPQVFEGLFLRQKKKLK